MPSGCGERTGNLFDVVQYRANYIHGKARDDSGTEFTAEYNGYSTYMVPVVAGETYVLKGTTSKKIDTTNWLSRIYFLNSQKQFVSRSNSFTNFTTDSVYTFTIPDGITYIELQMCTELTYDDVMLVKGSTAPSSYIPYGYKLPLTSAGQGVDIYLGESQTTRRIKKLVLTGEEEFWSATYWVGAFVFFNTVSTTLPQPVSDIGICSHFKQRGSQVMSSGEFNVRFTPASNRIVIGFGKSGFETIDDFKSFLASQYAAGTPVTVWYILAKPETAVVNEPLMKIGRYADTIDSTQATVQIPTTANSTTISWAGEGLAPSEVELTYRKPKGQ